MFNRKRDRPHAIHQHCFLQQKLPHKSTLFLPPKLYLLHIQLPCCIYTTAAYEFLFF
ncbi:hypothetical protein Mapa_011244 [Marchantia paleacea]|nr:hypothetical protein Mapa_011244 [Marchantia paleacea]